MLIDRVLIVGLGSIGKRHLRLARELLPGADIRVLRHQACDDVPEYADGCFSSLEQALAFGPKLAVIANPATCHILAALPLAGAGVHLLVEKPISNISTDALELVNLSLAQHAVLAIGYNLRFLPSLRHFRERICEGLIGNVWSVRAEIGQYLPAWRPDTDYRHGVSARRALGGGALLELSHEIDYLRWTFGEIDWVSATLSRQSNLEIDVEDTAHLILGFVPASGTSALIANVNLDFLRHDASRLCTAIGEKGSLRWNGLTGEVQFYPAGALAWQSLFNAPHQRDDSYRAQWQHVLACIRDGSRPLVSGEDGVQVLRIVEAARTSAETGGRARVSGDGQTAGMPA